MGCSLSKQKSPSKGSKRTTSWNKVVHRGLSIQVDRSIKTTDGSYIAAAFSANYGIIKNPAPVEALESSASLPKPSGKGSYPQHKVSTAPVGGTNKHLPEDIRGDTVLGIPILSANHESRSCAAQKSANESLETINILELMEGLAEEEQWHASDEPSKPSTHMVDTQWHASDEPAMPSTHVVDTQWYAHDEPSMPLTHMVDMQRSPPDKPTDDARTPRASSGKTAASRLRPKSFSSFKSIEDVDLALSARRSKTPPRDSNVNIDIRTHETNSNAADMMGSRFDDKPFRNPDNLQRALSFKYIFNDTPAASQINDRNARVPRGDGVVLATARLWGEGEGASASPVFSPTVSLKDWLSSSNHQSNSPGCLKGSFEPSILDAFQSFQSYTPEQGAPHHYSNSTEAQLVYAQGASSQSPSAQEGTANLSTRVEECGAPVFDPEMLDSFENAMKHLSKEEWDAVRGMEDSPRNFLRLVKALKKSSSNCMRNQNAFGDSMDRNTTQGVPTADAKSIVRMDSKDQFEPLTKPCDMKKLSLEKKLAFMRQSSLEVKKALVKASMKEDEERATVVFYSTTTRTDAKVCEDCNQVRNILQSLVGVCYVERSISELLEHEQELRHVLNMSTVIVPTIYVKRKYLVGVESIMHLHKKGLLGAMLQEAVSFGSKTSMPCICRGVKFVICPFCKGRRKLSRVSEETLLCRYCSGTGLIKCLNCSST